MWALLYMYIYGTYMTLYMRKVTPYTVDPHISDPLLSSRLFRHLNNKFSAGHYINRTAYYDHTCTSIENVIYTAIS